MLVFFLVLAVGTCLFFPRLAKVLVGLTLSLLLVGVVVVIGAISLAEFQRAADNRAAARAQAQAVRNPHEVEAERLLALYFPQPVTPEPDADHARQTIERLKADQATLDALARRSALDTPAALRR